MNAAAEDAAAEPATAEPAAEDAELLARADAARRCVRMAGALALYHYRRLDELDVHAKADDSPVTVADRQAEALLRRELSERFPGDGFLGEEHGDAAGTSGWRWIVDPIDATENFLRGIDVWATLVGLEHDGAMVAGFVYLPVADTLYHAVRGGGAFRDDLPIRVSDRKTLAEGTFVYSSPKYFAAGGRAELFPTLCDASRRTRGFGDFWSFLLVAEGAAEFTVEPQIATWDIAALLPIVTEAGGRFTDLAGRPTVLSGSAVASNGLVHDELLALLPPRP